MKFLFDFQTPLGFVIVVDLLHKNILKKRFNFNNKFYCRLLIVLLFTVLTIHVQPLTHIGTKPGLSNQ